MKDVLIGYSATTPGYDHALKTISAQFNGTQENVSTELRANVGTILENALFGPISKLEAITSDVIKASNNLTFGLRRSPYARFVKQGPLYTSLRKTEIACPEHLKGGIVSYIKAVSEVYVEVNQSLPKALASLKAEVAMLARGNDGLTKAKKDFGVELPILQWQNKIKAVTNFKTSKDRCTYSELVSRNSDWSVVEDQLQVLSKASGGFDPAAVLDGANDLSANINFLVEERLSDAEVKANAITITALGKAVHTLSLAVTIAGITAGLVIELVELEDLWAKRLKEIS